MQKGEEQDRRGLTPAMKEMYRICKTIRKNMRNYILGVYYLDVWSK